MPAPGDWWAVLRDGRALTSTWLATYGRGLAWVLLLFGPWAAACMAALRMPADWTIVASVAGGLWAGCLIPRDDETPVFGVPSARSVAIAALCLIGLELALWEQLAIGGTLANLAVAVTAAAACAGWSRVAASDAEPRWLAVCALFGGVAGARPLSDAWFAAPVVVGAVAVVAAGALVLRRAPRVASCVVVLAVASLTLPRSLCVGWWAADVNAIGVIAARASASWVGSLGSGWGLVPGGMDPLGYALGSVALLVVFEASWRDLAPRSRVADIAPVADRVTLMVQRRIWSPVITVALIGGGMFVCFSLPGLTAAGKFSPLLLNLMGGLPLVMIGALYHVTLNAPGMFARSAGYAAVPLAMAPVIALTALAVSPWWAWMVVLGAIGLVLWALVSGALLRRLGLGQAWSTRRSVLVGLAALAFVIPWPQRRLIWAVAPAAWLPLIPLGFHVIVLSRLPSRTIVRGAWVLGLVVAVAGAALGLLTSESDRDVRYVASIGLACLAPPVFFMLAAAAIGARTLVGRSLVVPDRYREDD